MLKYILYFLFVINRRKFYAEVLRTLRPGGLFILHFSNRKSIKGLLYELYLKANNRDRTEEELGNYLRDYHEQAAELERSGFKIIDTEGYNWNILKRNSDNSEL